jgi:hypothetical protein
MQASFSSYRNLRTVARLMSIPADLVSVPMAKISDIWVPDFEEASCLFGISSLLDAVVNNPAAKSLVLEVVTDESSADLVFVKGHTQASGSWYICKKSLVEVWIPKAFLHRLNKKAFPSTINLAVTDVRPTFTVAL